MCRERHHDWAVHGECDLSIVGRRDRRCDLSFRPNITNPGNTKGAIGIQNPRMNRNKNIPPIMSLPYPFALARLKLPTIHMVAVPRYNRITTTFQLSVIRNPPPCRNKTTSMTVMMTAQASCQIPRLRCLVIIGSDQTEPLAEVAWNNGIGRLRITVNGKSRQKTIIKGPPQKTAVLSQFC
jgi:hypothetical protein